MSKALIPLAFALAAAACKEIPTPPPPRFMLPHELTLRTTVESLSPIDPAGYCESGGDDCRVYLVNLAKDAPTARCPFVAIDYWPENGERHAAWPETIISTRDQAWNLVGHRYTSPRCYYALINATQVPR